MATASERIPVLVTPQQKIHITKLADAAGLKVGEYMRRAAESYTPSEDDAILEGMIEQMAKTTALASAAIDDALAYVEESNQRIAALEASTHQKAA